MPYFLCRLATEEGRILSQTLLAPSLEECRRHFESEGFCVLSIKKDWTKINIRTIPFEKKIKDRDFILFNQELMALIKAGYPILKSLDIIAGRAKNIHLKELLLKIQDEIQAGKSLSEAFTPFEKDFSKVYTASLMAGEQSGNLTGSIARFIHYAKVLSQTKSRIKSALIYPSLLLFFAMALLIVLVTFILPTFAGFYEGFQADLPFISRWMMGFSLVARKGFPFLILILLLAAAGFIRMKKGEASAITLDRWKLKIPLARRIWTEMSISLFSRTLGLLLEAGIPLLAAAGVSIKAVPNKFQMQKLKGLPDHIRNGEGLSESLAKAGFFSPLSLDMIRVGETSANLDGMLREVADVYDEQVRTKIDTFVSLIEPTVIIFIGLVVAGMLLSVYLPIFNTIQIVR